MQVHVQMLVRASWKCFLDLADTYQERDNQTTGLLKVNTTNGLLRVNSKNKTNQPTTPPLLHFSIATPPIPSTPFVDAEKHLRHFILAGEK